MLRHAGPRAVWCTAVALAASVLLACAPTLAPWNVAAAPAARTAAPANPLAALTDAQLADEVARLDREAQLIGEALLREDQDRAGLVLERDVAREMLGDWLAQAYRDQGSSGSVLASMLEADSFGEAADRARVATVVIEHHERLMRSLDGAEARLGASQLQRAARITRLGSVQARLVRVGDEQARRTVRRAEEQRRSDARQAVVAARQHASARAAAAAMPAPGMLVGAAGLGGMMPMASASPSAAAIDAYLASKASPMAGQGAAFVASGQRWGLDPRLLVAIAGAESSFGQQLCGPHNAWGWACPNDPADFGTWADGIDTVTEGLRRYYLDEGRTSVTLIQQKYCPVGAANDPTGLNNHWSTNVTKFLVEQGGNPASVGAGPSGGMALPDLGGLGLAAPR